MHYTKFWAFVLAAVVSISSGSVRAQESARIEPRTPSIIYFGEGLNQQVDERHYSASREQYVEGQQGEHLSRMEEERRRRNATGYGAISSVTGNARTSYVGGYTRKDGTYVRPHYKSRR